jgi:hypothetical protein
MKITRTNPITGEENTLDIPVTEEQLRAWNNGGLIQNVMPNLNADQREFLISGMTPGQFEELFPEDDEDDDLDEGSPDIEYEY